MNLIIKQSPTLTENLSSNSIVEALYQLTKPDPVSGETFANAVLVGRIQVPIAYEDAVNFLNTQFSADNSDNGSDFHVIADNYYIRFADQEVVSALTAKGVMEEGEGFTVAQAAQVKWADSWFRNNSLITTFDEIRYFTGLLQQGASGYPRTERTFQGATDLESVDITNIVALSYYEFAECPNLIRFHGKDGPVGVLNLESLQRYPSDGNMTQATATHAFYNCPGIQHITSLGSIPYIKHNMFNTCLNLEDVNLPLTCTGINDNAFDGDSKLTTINLSHVTYIGGSVFQNCSSLEYCDGPNSTQGELNLPNLVSLGTDAFRNTKFQTISNLGSITKIPINCFRQISTLTNVIIPNTVTSIENNAFNGCSGLSSVTISNSVTVIGTSAFNGCSGLTSINIPNSVTTIGSSAFQGCSGLASINIPNSVTMISSSVFLWCSDLTSITIPDSVTYVGADAFNGCSGLTSVTIGSGVTTIAYGAFNGCSHLVNVYITDIAAWCGISFNGNPLDSNNSGKHLYLNGVEIINLAIPNSVTSIGYGAFTRCGYIASVVIPDTVNTISNYAFAYDYSLTSVTIGIGVTGISAGAFYKCTALTSITITATTPPTISTSTFTDTNNCPIYVPSGSVSAYQTTGNWTTYASRIQAIPTA